jgi:hypothetical protein
MLYLPDNVSHRRASQGLTQVACTSAVTYPREGARRCVNLNRSSRLTTPRVTADNVFRGIDLVQNAYIRLAKLQPEGGNRRDDPTTAVGPGEGFGAADEVASHDTVA